MELEKGKLYYFQFPEYTGFGYVTVNYLNTPCERCVLYETCIRLTVQKLKTECLGSCNREKRRDHSSITITNYVGDPYFLGSLQLKEFFQTIGVNTGRYRFTPKRMYCLCNGKLYSKPKSLFNYFNYVPIIISEKDAPKKFEVKMPEEIDTISHGKE